MKYFPILIIFFLISHTQVMSQTDDSTNFVPDRPGMATPPNVMATKSFQIEDGLQYEQFTDGILQNENYQLSSLLIRYGVLKNVELRLQTNYSCNKGKAITTYTISGLNPVTIGSKIKLIEQKRALPNISLLLNITLPYLGKKEFRPDTYGPSFTLLMSNSISGKLNVCYNYGISWDGSSSVPTHFYALCLGVNLNSRWSTFVEGYGFSNQGAKPAYYIDAGFACLINGHLQIDISAAGYLNSFSDYKMINAGIALKI